MLDYAGPLSVMARDGLALVAAPKHDPTADPNEVAHLRMIVHVPRSLDFSA